MRKQMLLTKAIEKKLAAHPFGSQEGKGEDAKLLVKFFNPYGAGTWLITEAEKQPDGDWLMFGMCHIYEWEWGYVSFNELNRVRVNVFGQKLPLERDLYAGDTVREEIH